MFSVKEIYKYSSKQVLGATPRLLYYEGGSEFVPVNIAALYLKQES